MTSKSKRTACARCGVWRSIGKSSAVLCADCRYVLSEEERALWAREKVAA